MKNFNLAFLALTLTTPALADITLLPDVSPATEGQHVFINIPQQRLFLYTNGQLTKIYPVAVGKAMTQTNLGEHRIGVKAFNPTWHIPQSIQKERKDSVKSIPPGPKNPLGPVFVRLGDPKLGLGIHGTNAPASVPGVRSHGCVRMKSPDALEFAKTIATGSPAYVIYQMATLNEDSSQNLWLAAYRDPYNQKNLDITALKKSINAWAKAHGKNINTKRVDTILKARTGAANCLTCIKGSKLAGSLKSIAWTTGTSAYSKPKALPKPIPTQDEVLPAGTEIEIDAGDDTPAQSVKPATPKVAAPTPTPNAASAIKPLTPVKPAAAYPSQSIPTDSEPTELLF